MTRPSGAFLLMLNRFGHIYRPAHDQQLSTVPTIDAPFFLLLKTSECQMILLLLKPHGCSPIKCDVWLILYVDNCILLCRLWDLWTGVSDEVFTGHRGRINNLKVTPDGRKAVSVSDDSMAIMWDLDTRVKMREFQGHGAWINDAAITHNATKVITASGTVRETSSNMIVWTIFLLLIGITELSVSVQD